MNIEEVYDLYKPSGVITMKVDKFSEFAKEEQDARKLSNPIYIQGLPWKILVTPTESRRWKPHPAAAITYVYNKTLGYFLQCNAENQATNWNCHASAVLKVLAHKEGNEDHCREIKHTFNAKKNDWGFALFMSFEALMDPEESWYDAKTDSITLSVEINADIPVGIEMEIPSQVPENIGNLFDKRDQFSDCILISSDKIEFKAYKGILACSSPVFAGMFQHGMVEAQDGIVRIPDIRSEVLEPMLHFMYNGTKPNLEGKENIVGELLVAADKYELMPLKVFCEHKLATSLNNENACELVAFADLHIAKLLKSNALKFIKENSNEVIQTEGWKMLMKGIYGVELYNEIVKAIIEYAK